MPIPRLAPHTSDLKLTITIPKKDRPYITEMYQDEKLENETPDEYNLRVLIEKAHQFYVIREGKVAFDANEAENETEKAVIVADLEALTSELI